MANINLLVVQSFGSQQEADMAKGALESAGTDAITQADSVGGMRPHVAGAGGGIKLLVREEDEATAREILAPPKERA